MLSKNIEKTAEIAEGFLYLATAKAVTGQVLCIDGGFLLKQE